LNQFSLGIEAAPPLDFLTCAPQKPQPFVICINAGANLKNFMLSMPQIPSGVFGGWTLQIQMGPFQV
jgi:hypothetical protein